MIDERKLSDLEEVIFRETTTIGLRYLRASCHRLGRSFEPVATPWDPINVKIGYHHRGEIVQFAPEFKECEQVAKALRSIKAGLREVKRLFLNRA